MSFLSPGDVVSWRKRQQSESNLCAGVWLFERRCDIDGSKGEIIWMR